MKMTELKQIVESLGCEMKEYSTGHFIMLPIEFPWYGKHSDDGECENSRIIAQVVEMPGSSRAHVLDSVKWVDVWTVPEIVFDPSNGVKPLGLKMKKKSRGFAYTLQDFDSEELTAWLEKKIGEVSEKAKEYYKEWRLHTLK